jgi:protein phosphatase
MNGWIRRVFGKTDEQASVGMQQTEKSAMTNNSGDPENEAATEAADLKPVTNAATAPLPQRNIGEGVTRELPPEVMYSGMGEHFSFGQCTNVGKVRPNNQDAALSFFASSRSVDDRPDFGLFIVADGMGGHHHGEKASAITTRVMNSVITTNIYLPLMLGNQDAPPIAEALINAVQKANLEVIRTVPEGGTTVTAVAVIGDLAHIVHVGDSRAYLVSKEGLEQVTRDHSLVQRLIELDQLTPDEAAVHPQKNVLYRALGQNEIVEVDTITRRIPADARLLLCSDGLWAYVDERDIFEIAINNPDPQLACEKLVSLANARGGLDNITVILLKFASS